MELTAVVMIIRRIWNHVVWNSPSSLHDLISRTYQADDPNDVHAIIQEEAHVQHVHQLRFT